MFDNEQVENGMRAAVEFLNADTNIRNHLINNIMQSGNDSLGEIGFEVASLLQKKGIVVKPEHLAQALSQTYEYGLQRYIGEYDNYAISERDIFNENALVDARGMDAAMHRKNRIAIMVDDLDCRDHHVPSSWADFVNRGYSAIKSTLYKQYGDRAVETFEYYFNYDTRDILKYGLTSGLTKAHDRTMDEVQHLQVAASKLEEHVETTKAQTAREQTMSSNAAAFK